MADDTLQADYPALDQVAQQFGRAVEANQQLQKQVNQRMERLRQTWAGLGSQAFFAEMQGEVMPAFARLLSALQQAQQATQQISAAIQHAEQEAAALFKGEGQGATTPLAAEATMGAASGAAAGGTPVRSVAPQSFMGSGNSALGAANDAVKAAVAAAQGAAGGAARGAAIGGKLGAAVGPVGAAVGIAAGAAVGAIQGAAGGSATPDYDFTIQHEIGEGRYESRIPHWPNSEASGVTLGPGYDMGSRTKAQVIRNLTAVGVDQATAEQMAEGAGKKGSAAQAWVNAWRKEHGTKAFVLDRDQEAQLFRNVLVPQYEQGVKNYLARAHPTVKWDDLSVDQKTLLFDIQYNTRKGVAGFPTFTRAVLNEQWDTALANSQRRGAGSRRNNDFAQLIRDIKARTPKE